MGRTYTMVVWLDCWPTFLNEGRGTAFEGALEGRVLGLTEGCRKI